MVKGLKSVKVPVFDAQAFLDSAGVARKIVEYRKSQKIYSQGDSATKVMYLQKGGVKLSVVNEVGKEAILAILGPGLEGALAWLGRWFPPLANISPPTPIGRAVRFVLGCSTVFAYVCALYWVGVPPEARRRMRLVPGAIITVVLNASLGFAYALYLSNVGDGATYSAGLKLIGVTLTALYLFTVALLTGAVVNRKLGARAKG